MLKKGKAGKSQGRRQGQARDIAYTTQVSVQAIPDYIGSCRAMRYNSSDFYETDLNKMSTVQSPALINTTVSHACALHITQSGQVQEFIS